MWTRPFFVDKSRHFRGAFLDKCALADKGKSVRSDSASFQDETLAEISGEL